MAGKKGVRVKKPKKKTQNTHPKDCMCLRCFTAKGGATMNFLVDENKKLRDQVDFLMVENRNTKMRLDEMLKQIEKKGSKCQTKSSKKKSK